MEFLSVVQEIISHTFNNITIAQRPIDGYINLTAMCKACGKRLSNYTRLDTTQAFLAELSTATHIRVSELIQVVKGGFPELQGTFGHPYVAIQLAQWLSPKFAVQVCEWVFEWIRAGVNPIPQPILPPEAAILWMTMQSLRLSEASKLRLITHFGKMQNLDVSYLPKYTEERLTQSLTEQLKLHGARLSALKANRVLLALGIIEEQSRPSTQGTRKFFKVLTEEGLKYGKNLISLKNERQTQPHYYTDTFPELLAKINQWLKQHSAPTKR